MNDDDFTYIARVEKAIEDKYGKETLVNPKALWDQQKEQIYLNNIKKIEIERLLKEELTKEEDTIIINDISLPIKLFKNKQERSCPLCKKYSFNPRDDVYLLKFNMCEECHEKKYG